MISVKKIIVGFIFLLASLAGFVYLRQIQATYPTGYFVGITASTIGFLAGAGLLLTSVAHFVRSRTGEVKEGKIEEMKRELLTRLSPYIERFKKDLGTKGVYNSSRQLVRRSLTEAYSLVRNPSTASSLAHYIIDLLSEEYPLGGEPLKKEWGRYARGLG